MIFRLEHPAQTTLKIIFSGSLDIESVAKIWHPCLQAVNNHHPLSLILDVTEVDYCDGAGIALIKELQKLQTTGNNECIISGLQPALQKLLEYPERQPHKPESDYLLPLNLPEQLGQLTVDALKNLRDNIIFLGMLTSQLFAFCFKARKLRWGDFLRIAEDTGPQALPIVALIGFLIGLISTFQAAPSFADLGVQIYMVDLVGLGLVREMGPLLTAVLLAGRTASSFAAELGTMKINQELDALKTMGIDPIRFLVIPRVLVTILITPLLEMLFIIFGLLGCLTVMTSLGYTVDAFFHRLHQAIVPLDYIGGLLKVFVFGLVIASIGCLHGIKTRFGAQAVGRSTTQAVVSSLIMLVVIDGIFALVYYVLGI